MKDHFFRFLVFVVSVILLGAGLFYTFTKPETYSAGIWIVVIGAALLFFCYISPRMRGMRSPYGSFTLDKESSDRLATKIANQVAPQIQSIAEQGTQYINHEQAFRDVLDLITDVVDKQKNASIELRLIAVAMSYSWPFIQKHLLPLVRIHKNVHFTLQCALVSPGYLAHFDLDVKNFDWAKYSKNLKKEISDLEKRLCDEGLNNFTIETYYFEGIPQWHGVLLNGKNLFLGRTDWKHDTQSRKPRLLVGSNTYRFYDTSTDAGELRISAFRHWFTYYCSYYQFRCLGDQSPDMPS